MPRLPQFVLALGFAIVLPTVAFADLPKADWAESVNPGREQLRSTINALRHIVRQERAGLRVCCGPNNELEAMERELRQLEYAYLRGQPVKMKSLPPDPRREKK
jgi:hypothetical protein